MKCPRCNVNQIEGDWYTPCIPCRRELRKDAKTDKWFCKWAELQKGRVPEPRKPYLDPPTEAELIELRGKDGNG